MEFRGFDDDLFSETEIKLKKTAKVDYQPKTVLPEWYTEKQALPPEDMEKAYFYIFRGNHDYYQGAWSSALEAYTRALDYIAPNNGSMRRLLCESLARCRWKCGDADGAVEMGKKLVEESTNDHQLFCAHSAMALFYDAAGNTKDQAESLRYCLDIRPLSSQHWIQLAKIYLQKIQSKDSGKFSTDHADDDLEVKRHIAEFDDNCSVGSFNSQYVHVSQRTDNNYSSEVEACPSGTIASCVLNGDTHTRKGLEEHRDMQTEQLTSLSNDEHILDNSPGDLLRKRLDRNPFPHGTRSNVSGDACERRNSNHKLASSVASESVKPRPVLAARENIPRRSSASTVGPDPDNGTLEADELERLSLTSEGFPEVKDVQSNGSGECVDGGGDRAEEDDPFMQAVTCLLKAQVILKSLQICAVSLTKTRNAQLLAEIDGLISTLHLDPAFLQDVSKKMYNEVFEKDIKEEETHGS